MLRTDLLLLVLIRISRHSSVVTLDNNGLLLLSHKHLKQQNARSGTHCLEQITTVE